MARRYTAEEKGKGLSSDTTTGGRKRIRAPEFDNSDLIKANSLSLIGRVTNPSEQRIWSLIDLLPKKWSLEGRVVGSYLGHDKFLIRFDLEKDMKKFLENRLYSFCNWMVILQRWEPFISRSFPSQIPFWIQLQGLPLHFCHQKMIYKIGQGTLDDYDISSTSARIRLLLDGLQPITTEVVIDFDTGEDVLITLEYEGLENHCSHCFRLTHLKVDCPFMSPVREDRNRDRAPSPVILPQEPIAQRTSSHGYRDHRPQPPVIEKERTDFGQRLDRHDRPFGDRVSASYSLARPLRNKITPGHALPSHQSTRVEVHHNTQNQQLQATSPPYSRHREARQPYKRTERSSHEDNWVLTGERQSQAARRQGSTSSDTKWVERQPRPPVERNLYLSDFPPLPPIPTKEQVMEELKEHTYQYVYCQDPKEIEARRQHVLDGDVHGLMEETAANIIATSTENVQNHAALLAQLEPTIQQPGDDTLIQDQESDTPAVDPPILPEPPAATKRRGRPPQGKKRKNASKQISGSVTRSFNVARILGSPASGRLHIGGTSTPHNQRGTPLNDTSASPSTMQNQVNPTTPPPAPTAVADASPDISAGQRRIRSQVRIAPRADFRPPGGEIP